MLPCGCPIVSVLCDLDSAFIAFPNSHEVQVVAGFDISCMKWTFFTQDMKVFLKNESNYYKLIYQRVMTDRA